MRLFVAINFSEEIKGVLIRAIDDLRKQSVSGNFTRTENLHLTLAFIGESNDIRPICNSIDQCDATPFNLTIGGAGNFGDLYWAGIESNQKLKNLAESLRNNLRASGFEIETRDFKPHITIARQLSSEIPVRITVPRTSMIVSRISLMKSERINGKLTYTEVYGREL